VAERTGLFADFYAAFKGETLGSTLVPGERMSNAARRKGLLGIRSMRGRAGSSSIVYSNGPLTICQGEACV
jgi:hypothetical protein